MRIVRSALVAAAAAAVALVVAPLTASAALVTFQTPVGATTGGLPVNAKVTFTTSANTVDVLLENLQANPVSVTQCLSGLLFELDGGQTGGTLVSSSGIDRFVANDGTFTDGAVSASGWGFTNLPPANLNVLGTPTAPTHVIIGPPGAGNLYTAANGSIRGNNAHNPFFAQSATFSLNVPGVTANTGITSVTFQFNTAPGNTVTVPEPAALGLGGLGLALATARRRRTA